MRSRFKIIRRCSGISSHELIHLKQQQPRQSRQRHNVNWEGASLYLHSTEEGPIVRNRSAIWLKSSIYRSFCVNRVSIMHRMQNNKFKPTSSAGGFLTPLSRTEELSFFDGIWSVNEIFCSHCVNATCQVSSNSIRELLGLFIKVIRCLFVVFATSLGMFIYKETFTLCRYLRAFITGIWKPRLIVLSVKRVQEPSDQDQVKKDDLNDIRQQSDCCLHSRISVSGWEEAWIKPHD